ncbi:hypothetical protein ACFXTH_008255 [Malus domestica]
MGGLGLSTGRGGKGSGCVWMAGLGAEFAASLRPPLSVSCKETFEKFEFRDVANLGHLEYENDNFGHDTIKLRNMNYG